MDRLACVDTPFLPLQVLLRREPSWRSCPAAVVESDAPQAPILHVNRIGRRQGVLPGMRYATALSLERDLRAAVVDSTEIEECVGALGQTLVRFSPALEPSDEEPGVFWLDLRGLERLVPDFAKWAREVRAALEEEELLSGVAVGFRRFGTYAAARSHPGETVVFEDVTQEDERTARTPLSLLGLQPRARDTLTRLGVRTVRDLLRLPRGGLRRRFGDELWRLVQLASGDQTLPFRSTPLSEPLRGRVILDHGVDRSDHLLMLIEDLLTPLLGKLVTRGEGLAALTLELAFDHEEPLVETIAPAEATQEAGRLLGLVLLRLEGLRLREGAVEVGLEVQGRSLRTEQGELFQPRPARDLADGNRALARLRARFGNDCVFRAFLTEGHLPEAGFHWERCDRLELPRPPSAPSFPSLVRRFHSPPRLLAPRARHEPDGWMLGGPETGSVTKLLGPYIVAGGWWLRAVHREYYFAETRKGPIYWVYYDRAVRRWFLQGTVR